MPPSATMFESKTSNTSARAADRCWRGSTGRAGPGRSRRCCRSMAAPGSTKTAPTTISSRRRWPKAASSSPRLISACRPGEQVHLPPALVFGGDKDEWVPVELMRHFADSWRKAGGEVELQLYEGANHGFMTGKPDAPYAARAIERMKAFIRKHTTG